jgi:hypothetical protein
MRPGEQDLEEKREDAEPDEEVPDQAGALVEPGRHPFDHPVELQVHDLRQHRRQGHEAGDGLQKRGTAESRHDPGCVQGGRAIGGSLGLRRHDPADDDRHHGRREHQDDGDVQCSGRPEPTRRPARHEAARDAAEEPAGTDEREQSPGLSGVKNLRGPRPQLADGDPEDEGGPNVEQDRRGGRWTRQDHLHRQQARCLGDAGTHDQRHRGELRREPAVGDQ